MNPRLQLLEFKNIRWKPFVNMLRTHVLRLMPMWTAMVRDSLLGRILVVVCLRLPWRGSGKTRHKFCVRSGSWYTGHLTLVHSCGWLTKTTFFSQRCKPEGGAWEEAGMSSSLPACHDKYRKHFFSHSAVKSRFTGSWFVKSYCNYRKIAPIHLPLCLASLVKVLVTFYG